MMLNKKRHEPVVPRVKSEWLHLKSVIRLFCFYDERAYCAFFVPFSLKNSEKEESSLMEREVKSITHGSIDIEQLSEAEQRAFYATLLARVLGLYRKQREGAE